jgi:hypothetical protein
MIIQDRNQINAAETDSPSRSVLGQVTLKIFLSKTNPLLLFDTRSQIELNTARGSA